MRAQSGAQADREACKLSSNAQAHREACELYAVQAHWEASPLTSMASLLPFHYSMPSFINFRRVLDLLEVKNQVSQCLRSSDGGRVFGIHSHFLHGT